MGTTKIEWAEKSWNPMTGCTRISEGCANCYAKRMAKRLKAMGNPKYFYEFMPRFHPGALSEPAGWKKPCQIFVCSMGDLFHKKIFDSEIEQVWEVMEEVDRHKYMVLTKRPERMFEWTWGNIIARPHIALGTTAENQARLVDRLMWLQKSCTQFRFLSLEPLLGPICLKDADPAWDGYINLVIVGGESGPKARPMNPAWVQNIRDECRDRGVPFMFKQWGEWTPDCLCWPPRKGHTVVSRPLPGPLGYMWRCGKRRAGRVLDGYEYNGKINWRA